MNLIEILIDKIDSMGSDSTCSDTLQGDTQSESEIIIIQLDHIRSRQIYVKTLTKWFRELDLIGVLLLYKKIVLLLVSGDKTDVQVCVYLLHSVVSFDLSLVLRHT